MSFLISAGVHALLFLFFLRTFGLVKILPIQRKVTPVRIVPSPPSPKLFLPRPEDLKPGVGVPSPGQGPGTGGGGGSGGGGEGTATSRPGAASGGNPEIAEKAERVLARREGQAPPAPIIGEFRLSKTPGEPRPGVPVLVLGPKQTGIPGVDTKKYAPPGDFDFRQYLYSRSPTAETPPAGPSSGRGSIRSSGGGGPGGSPTARIYDITPWARAAVELVQKNWTISQLRDLGANLSVRISVTIGKGGELSSLTVVSSSEIPLFDQAALHAIEQSVPFPRLPDDFPDETLEILLVFELHG